MFNLRNLFLAAVRGQHAAGLARVKPVFRPRRMKARKYWPHQGQLEIERRASQIQRGVLRTN